jgi:YD repeat-containing protein
VTDPLGNVTAFQYDEAGRLVRVISPGAGSEAERTTLHTYDELGRRIAIGGGPWGSVLFLEFSIA